MTVVRPILSWDNKHKRFVTLYTSGTPAGQVRGRSDYWSLTLKQATELAAELLATVIAACDAEIAARACSEEEV